MVAVTLEGDDEEDRDNNDDEENVAHFTSSFVLVQIQLVVCPYKRA